MQQRGSLPIMPLCASVPLWEMVPRDQNPGLIRVPSVVELPRLANVTSNRCQMTPMIRLYFAWYNRVCVLWIEDLLTAEA